MLAVDTEVGFTDALTNFRTGAVSSDKLGLMNVLLAEGLNLGLRKWPRLQIAMDIGNFSATHSGTLSVTLSTVLLL